MVTQPCSRLGIQRASGPGDRRARAALAAPVADKPLAAAASTKPTLASPGPSRTPPRDVLQALVAISPCSPLTQGLAAPRCSQMKFGLVPPLPGDPSEGPVCEKPRGGTGRCGNKWMDMVSVVRVCSFIHLALSEHSHCTRNRL